MKLRKFIQWMALFAIEVMFAIALADIVIMAFVA